MPTAICRACPAPNEGGSPGFYPGIVSDFSFVLGPRVRFPRGPTSRIGRAMVRLMRNRAEDFRVGRLGSIGI